jgi:hypothetical protein
MTDTRPKPVNWNRLGKLALERIDPRDKVVTRRCYMALRGRHELSAAEYLSVCAHLGIDPMTQAPAASGDYPKGMPEYRGELVWSLVGMGALGKRALDGLTMEQAGRRIGISAASLSRVCRGDVMSANIFLKVCAWIGKHPNEMTVRSGALDRVSDPFSRAEAAAELERSGPIAERVNARSGSGS